MEKKKIYLAQCQIDWHNCDPESDVYAYYKEENAKAKIAEMIKKFKSYCTKHDIDIVWDQSTDSAASIETNPGDRFTAWIDSVILH